MVHAHATEQLVLVQSEEAAHEDAVDALLAGKKTRMACASALARAGALWDHPALHKMLTHPESALAAACVLAESDPEGFDAWLEGDYEVDEETAIPLLRARIVRASEPFDLRELDELVEALAAIRDEEKWAARMLNSIEGLTACAAPQDYARAFLSGHASNGWLRHPEAVADFLCTHGETSWLETLALLEVSACATAFEFGAMIAVSASAGLQEFSQEDGEALLATLKGASQNQGAWEAQAIERGFSMAVSLGEDDLTALLVQAAVHESLFWNDLPSLGMSGLPLSGNDDASLDAEAAVHVWRDVLDEPSPDDDVVVAVVRTLWDLRRLHSNEIEAIDPIVERERELLEGLAEHANAAINLAARRVLAQVYGWMPERLDLNTPRDVMIAGLDAPGAPEALALLTQQEGVASLWAMQELAQLPLEDAAALFATVWSSVAPSRGVYVRALIRDMLEEDEFLGF